MKYNISWAIVGIDPYLLVVLLLNHIVYKCIEFLAIKDVSEQKGD